MNYFNNIADLNSLKNAFRNLCIKLHPDTSGYNSQSDFIKMHKEFKTLSKSLKFTTGKESDKEFNEKEFYNIVQKFSHIEGLTLDFIGDHIWVTNTKYSQKEDIKSIKIQGYKRIWARNKQAWWFRPDSYVAKKSKGSTLEELRSTFNSQSFKTKQAIKLTA